MTQNGYEKQPLYAIISLIVFEVILIGGVGWHRSRRAFYPLRGSYPQMLWSAGVGVWWAGALGSLDQLIMIPCALWWYIFQLAIDLWLWSVIFRCGMLLFQCKIQEDSFLAEKIVHKKHSVASVDLAQPHRINHVLQQQSGEPAEHQQLQRPQTAQQWKPNWFTRNRWLMKRSTLTKALAIDLLMQTIVFITTYQYSEWDSCTSLGNKDFFIDILIARIAWSSILSTMITIPSFILRKYDANGHGLITEFKLIAATVFVGCCSVIVVLAILKDYAKAVNVVDWILPPFMSLVILIMYWRPVWTSYQWQKKCEQVGEIGSLEELLKVPGASEAFLAFCKTEFSSENLLFYTRVVDLKAAKLNRDHNQSSDENLSTLPDPTPVTVFEEINSIYEAFIRPAAPFEVNVSSLMRDQITSRLQQYQQFVNCSDNLASDDAIKGLIIEVKRRNSTQLLNTGSSGGLLQSAGFMRRSSRTLMQLAGNNATTTTAAPGSPLPTLITIRLGGSAAATTNNYEASTNSSNGSSQLSSTAAAARLPVISISNGDDSSAAANARLLGGNVTPQPTGSGSSRSVELLRPLSSGGSRAPTAPLATDRSGISSSTPAIEGKTPTEQLCELMRCIFDNAQDAVLRLMQANSFARFHGSPFYHKWMEEYKGWTPGAIMIHTHHSRHSRPSAEPSAGSGGTPRTTGTPGTRVRHGSQPSAAYEIIKSSPRGKSSPRERGERAGATLPLPTSLTPKSPNVNLNSEYITPRSSRATVVPAPNTTAASMTGSPATNNNQHHTTITIATTPTAAAAAAATFNTILTPTIGTPHAHGTTSFPIVRVESS